MQQNLDLGPVTADEPDDFANLDFAPMPEEMLRAFSIAARRDYLCLIVPPCPECRAVQVQLCNFTTPPDPELSAEWKCRECKHRWSWLP
jgi:hypothetical protein